jgi:hypothetical protein
MTYDDVCCTYADIAGFVRQAEERARIELAQVSSRMLTYADVMLTYADVC